jgi:cell shape-determining protein MreD
MTKSLALVAIASLIDRTFGPISFALPLFLIISLHQGSKTAIPMAFFSGIIADLFLGRTLGLSSLLFLLIIMQNYLYTQRFDANNWWSISLLGAVASLEAAIFWRPGWGFNQWLIQTILVVGLWLFTKWQQRWLSPPEVYLKS